jgi:hypothetical protein
MSVSQRPSLSSAARMRPMRPSIMSDGASTSAPAEASSRDWSIRRSMVASLSTQPRSSTPSWPWSV